MSKAVMQQLAPLQALAPEHAQLLRQRAFPDWIEPMKARLVDQYFSDPGWLFERKLDGVRIIAYKRGDEVEIYSRNKIRQDHRYPEIVDSLRAQNIGDCVLDGEVVAFKGKRDSFALLSGRFTSGGPEVARASGIGIEYYVFDVLHLEGQDTMRLPLVERKKLLKAAITWDDTLRFTEHRVEHGEKFLKEAYRAGWEGLIAKAADSAYQPGKRSPDWLKFKCSREQEFVIVGYTEPQGQRCCFGALLLGYYDGDELRYAGKVGTGFSDALLRDLHRQMRRLEVKRCRYTDEVREKVLHCLKPELVCQVGFTEWTADGRLRHPRFLGLRDDKDPREVVREAPSG